MPIARLKPMYHNTFSSSQLLIVSFLLHQTMFLANYAALLSLLLGIKKAHVHSLQVALKTNKVTSSQLIASSLPPQY